MNQTGLDHEGSAAKGSPRPVRIGSGLEHGVHSHKCIQNDLRASSRVGYRSKTLSSRVSLKTFITSGLTLQSFIRPFAPRLAVHHAEQADGGARQHADAFQINEEVDSGLGTPQGVGSLFQLVEPRAIDEPGRLNSSNATCRATSRAWNTCCGTVPAALCDRTALRDA